MKNPVPFALTLVLALGVLSAVPSAASANAYTNYSVCGVSLSPASSITAAGGGTVGLITLHLSSGSNCSGTQVTGLVVCSTGASSSVCNSSFLWTADELHTLFLALQQALITQSWVSVGTDSTHTTQVSSIFFGQS